MDKVSRRGRTLLLTNDDGIDAAGLAALVRAVEGLGRAVVVAPTGPWSCRGHAVTTDAPIPFREVGPDRYAVDGTPADCVRLALFVLAPEVDWVVAGINAGGNLGADIHHSGTVAAAREGGLHGRRGLAISHYRARGRPFDWDRATTLGRLAIDRVLADRDAAGVLWNVNLPHLTEDEGLPEVVVCPLDPSPLPVRFEIEDGQARYRGDYQSRLRVEGGDVATCFGGRISVSRLPCWPSG